MSSRHGHRVQFEKDSEMDLFVPVFQTFVRANNPVPANGAGLKDRFFRADYLVPKARLRAGIMRGFILIVSAGKRLRAGRR